MYKITKEAECLSPHVPLQPSAGRVAQRSAVSGPL